MARGWSVPQSRPRVAVPTGLFPSYRRTCGSRLESVFGCFAVRSLVYSLLPNVRVLAEARFDADSQEPLVHIIFL